MCLRKNTATVEKNPPYENLAILSVQSALPFGMGLNGAIVQPTVATEFRFAL